MEESPRRRDRHSFVVRVWCELVDGDGGATAWRGCVDHVGTGRRLYFTDPQAIVRFVCQQIGLPGERRHWWASLLRWIGRESAS